MCAVSQILTFIQKKSYALIWEHVKFINPIYCFFTTKIGSYIDHRPHPQGIPLATGSLANN